MCRVFIGAVSAMSELTLPRDTSRGQIEGNGQVTLEMLQVPLGRRHNVLRAGSGLIRKCLTLVKPDPTSRMSSATPSATPIKATAVAAAFVRVCSRIHYEPHARLMPASVLSHRTFYRYVTRNIYVYSGRPPNVCGCLEHLLRKFARNVDTSRDVSPTLNVEMFR